jgi:hypothetical protein
MSALGQKRTLKASGQKPLDAIWRADKEHDEKASGI